jgi:hypothetical protein
MAAGDYYPRNMVALGDYPGQKKLGHSRSHSMYNATCIEAAHRLYVLKLDGVG